MSGLTGQGWPRPRVAGWPVPWVSPAEDLSQMDPARVEACCSGAICAVCGGDFAAEERALALVLAGDRVLEPGADLAELGIDPMDSAVMHHRCARLALAWCPALKRRVDAGDLVCVEVPAGAGEPVVDDFPSRIHPRFDGADCAVVAMPPVGRHDT